ncbi:MAG: energy-coupling factor ABC transporter permease [Asgard group archaeon]|nr:energy-coupling factor ABC transporter permease [Asgard group archaeon]
MHMPDGVIPTNQAIVYLVFSAIIILIAIWQSRKSLTLKQIPIVGVLGAGLFAAQMFNFPIPFGSSGHLIGTALATTLTGPWVGILILTSILIIQSFFGDGGFLALGLNSLNMAIVGALTTFVIFLIIPKKWRQKTTVFSVFAGIAGFISTLIMALFASTELSIASVGEPSLIFGWMMGLHAIIGAIEGIITFTLVFFIFKADASLYEAAEDSLYTRGVKQDDFIESEPKYKFPVWATVTTTGVFGVMSLFGIIASENPDGLERTFDFINDSGSTINPIETGIFNILYENHPNLPTDKLWWTIMELGVIMVALFLIILLISYITFLVKKRKYNRQHLDSSEDNEVEMVEEQTQEQVETVKLTNVVDRLES